MKNPNSELILTDGSLDWSEGVNSDVVSTVQTEINPNGLHRDQVAWLDNATNRGGGLIQRTGWLLKGTMPGDGIYQGVFSYLPDNEYPYLIFVRGGEVWAVNQDDFSQSVNLSAKFSLSLPLVERVWFCQAEQYLIIQVGDGVTLPLFWDNATLRQSLGITDTNATPASGPGINEIPCAQAMVYYLGRVWYSQDRTVSAGDIVGGPSGTLANDFRDAVLNVTENPLCVGGDGFTVPTSAGNIRGLAYASNLNVQLGEGALYIGTRNEIYSLSVPMTRSEWIASDSASVPKMVVALEANGWVNDRSIVAVNGDLFFQSLEPSIRSLTTAIRNFQQWGNVPISVNEQRALQFVDRALLHLGSGIYFDNRLLETSLPYRCPVGVAHKCILPLNFDVISTFERNLAPCWEGMWEGINFLELTSMDYGGRERAFSPAWSDDTSNIDLWELTTDSRWEKDGNTRVSWYIEFPAFTFGKEFQLKKLVGGELWIDKLLGQVVFRVEYRPDGDPCWYPWHEWTFCTAKDSCENVANPVCVYPATMRESYRQTVTLPNPPRSCEAVMGRPANVGYQFQTRLSILGWCRIRGLLLHAEPVERKLWDKLVC